MRFTLIDRITELRRDEYLAATKCLTLAEDYLKDHFPRFPIMPGVLMLEALYQASAWLVRYSADFSHSVVQLNEAKNVKFADFVQPGQTLVVTTEIKQQTESQTTLNAEGKVDGRLAVKSRLVLGSYNLRDSDSNAAPIDAFIVKELRQQLANLYPESLQDSTAVHRE
jgi:3-hydroxyacyl-[acyl-carrier-protein] dehydratase